MLKREFRTWKTEVRMQDSDGKQKIFGHAAVYDQLSEPMRVGNRTFRERVMPGAFDKCLASNPDIRGLFNHDPSLILGRTKAGTMTVRSDADGIEYIIDPPNTSYANDLRESMARGDVDQSSFGFYMKRDDWKDTPDGLVRELIEVDCFDVSPVTYPAYSGSSSGVRSAEEMRAMFPDGMPEIPQPAKEKRENENGCDCDCSECEDDNCEGCTMDGCDDPECAAAGCPMQEGRSGKKKGEKREAKTKTVDGVEHPASDFAHVGDPKDPSTWKLLIHDAAHVRNALARFNQVQGLSKEEKDAAYKKILAAAKKFGIKVSEENAAKLYGASYRDAKAMLRDIDPDGDGDDDTPLVEALSDACDACRTVAGTACGALWTFWDGKPEYSNPLLKAFVEQAGALKADLDKAIAEAQRELDEPIPPKELNSRRDRWQKRFLEQ